MQDEKKTEEKKKIAKEKLASKATAKDQQQENEETNPNWEDFEEITKGNFNRLLGCG